MSKLILLLSLMFNNGTLDETTYKVSYYGKEHHGKRTSSGEKFNMYSLTAAHKTLKFGTKVRVTNFKNHKSVIVTINDRGPFIKSREFDLSRAAFIAIADSKKQGVLEVTYTILSNGE